ncbi:hypothetical protein BGZ76_007331 [Entomortierella beljakovae]|nr:hypothetical protein BGZ76_007331 [Entomortierella beljakovae]
MSHSPKVIIVGAGLGGLMLGILLEKMGVEYNIYERAAAVKPLGAAMGFGPNIMPVFEQLGMYDDLRKLSFPAWCMDILNSNLGLIGSMDLAGNKKSIGYDAITFSRPDFYNLLLSRVPKEKIHYSKKAASIEQTQDKAILRCTDGTSYEADILIGADGAYSVVRQNIFDSLQKEGKLIKSDLEQLDLGYTCLVGTSSPLDPERYPQLKDERSHFSVVIADGKPHSTTILSVPGNRICFGVVIQLSPEEKANALKNPEWSSQSVEATVDKLRDTKIPFGGTLGDIFDNTPKDLISNVYLEEKMFETWTHGRVALLGDGAVNAMQDAVILANCIYDLAGLSTSDVAAALEDYKQQRHIHAKTAVETSASAGKLLYGQTWFEKLLRKIIFGWMPKWLEENNLKKSAAYQPQVTFLPLIPKKGTLQTIPQKMSKRYQAEQDQKAKAASSQDPPMSEHSSTHSNQPLKVMIVGAGLGGLLLGLFLDKIGIEYIIYERSTSLKPYGAGMSLGANILPVFEQLGIYEDLLKISFPCSYMDMVKEDMTPVSRMNIGGNTGTRPDVHRLLLSKIPEGKILYGKKVLSVGQSEHGALIRCADGTSYEGDILIGADGAYSAVRQGLYERLKKEGKLPSSDSVPMEVGYSCLVGTTKPLDPEKYPVLKDEFSHFAVVLSDGKPYSTTVISVPGNRVCWGVVVQLTPEEKKLAIRNTEWGSETVEAAVATYIHLKTPFGGTLGDFIKETPEGFVSNVYLEEKTFETWNSGRTALLGDACHKMLPSAGQGAINAMQDAVVIANCIYELGVSASNEEIEAALDDYKKQRFEHAKGQVRNSSVSGNLLYSQSWFSRIVRKIVLAFIPKEFEKTSITKTATYRPQASFLPLTEKRGTLEIVPQKPSKRYQEEQKKLKSENASVVASEISPSAI